ncbi:hypothetical protein BJY52DRAFT_1214106 [Lactarius psammicola]|nr:hypothetical protein BJY52DRAFT_1214106 [Lactarius psammicola]
MVVNSERGFANVRAWILPDIDVDFPNEIDCSSIKHSVRVAFTFTNKGWSAEADMGTFDAVMEALPLDDLVTLIAQNRKKHLDERFWLRHTPKWPLLWQVRLAPYAARGFREMLLEDNGGCESPLLPSLTKLVLGDVILVDTALADSILSARWALRLRDALMKRVEQGVPLETLDLRACLATSGAVELLSEIVADVLGPKENIETGGQMLSLSLSRGIIFDNEDEDEADYCHNLNF